MQENAKPAQEETLNEETKCAQEACGACEDKCECEPQSTEQTAEQKQAEEVAAEPTLEEQLTVAKDEAAKWQDLYLRAMAEMENNRRRAEEAVEKAHKFGIEKFAKNLLPVVDSMQKAVETVGEDDSPVAQGVQVTYRQMLQALEQSGMKVIAPAGEKFDPTLHQAITMMPAAEGQEKGVVGQVFQAGWLLNDRVLRAAMVAVTQ